MAQYALSYPQSLPRRQAHYTDTLCGYLYGQLVHDPIVSQPVRVILVPDGTGRLAERASPVLPKVLGAERGVYMDADPVAPRLAALARVAIFDLVAAHHQNLTISPVVKSSHAT